MGWGMAGGKGLITREIRLHHTSFSSRALSSSIMFRASWIMLLSILTDFASWINECCNRKNVIQTATLLITAHHVTKYFQESSFIVFDYLHVRYFPFIFRLVHVYTCTGYF